MHETSGEADRPNGASKFNCRLRDRGHDLQRLQASFINSLQKEAHCVSKHWVHYLMTPKKFQKKKKNGKKNPASKKL